MSAGTPDRRLFGTDGVRGLANDHLTVDLAFDLARAAGEGSDGPVVIGRDTRRSSPMLNAALQAGFNSVGVDTVDLGIIPVGAVSRLARETKSQLGVMVSASHNPAEDNGIKFFGFDGRKLSDEKESRIESRIERGAPWQRPTGPGVGIHTTMPEAIDRYLGYLTHDFDYSLRGLEFAVDCANGAAFAAAPQLFERLRADAEVFCAEPDGTNINNGCGATHPGFLAAKAKGRIGFAFDGDADRLIAIDEAGQTVDGDVLMAIFAQHLHEQGKLRDDTVVTTVMANLGFKRAMNRLGLKVIETQVGDRYVLEAMLAHKVSLGGEQSGHIVLEDRTTGDGLRTALRLSGILAATGKPLTELRKVMIPFPQVLQNVPVTDKSGLEDATALWEAVSETETRLGREGRVLVRASGTENLIRVMVEARGADQARAEAQRLCEVVVAELG